MPRPSIGAAARTKIVTSRWTEAEVETLTRIFGSPGRAMRTIVGGYLAKLDAPKDQPYLNRGSKE